MPRPRAYRGSGVGGAKAVLKFRNRRITVLRGTTTDVFGDLSDVGTPLYTNVQAAIAEVNETVFDAATQRPQTIRAVKCTVPAWADIQASDTIQDTFTGWYYIVESIEELPGLGYYPPPKLLTLRMRSGVTVTSD